MVMIATKGAEIRLTGDLTTQTAAEDFRHTPVFSEPLYRVDLQKIDKIDSAGLALLVYWKTRAKASVSELEFTNSPEKLLEMADLGGLVTIFS